MKTNKFDALEAVIATQQITERELKDWFENRLVLAEQPATVNNQLIPTELPIVYRKDNEFEVLNGLDLSRKDEVWGTELFPDIMVALKYGNKVYTNTSWENVKIFAEKMTYKGKPGKLPSLRDAFPYKRKKLLDTTVSVLKENGIEAHGYYGWVWYREDYAGQPYFFDLEACECYRWSRDNPNFMVRTAVSFR